MVYDNDNRIAFPPTKVDFNNEVGITGQSHDEYPKAGEQPRYDWMRLFLIGLLSQQSSTNPPTQYRIGTPWFNKDKQAIYIWDGEAWTTLASFIAVEEDDSGGIVTLLTKISEINTKIDSIQPRYTFSGIADSDKTSINVPSTITDALGSNPDSLRPLVYINGLLADPRRCNFAAGCPSKIELTGEVELNTDDRFTVIIEKFDTFVEDTVIA